MLVIGGCAPVDDGGLAAQPDATGRCRAPDDIDSSPNSISETIDLFNALPRPVTVACFVESLDRPVEVIASVSGFSAQPAAGLDAPRIFAIYDQLVLSFVPDGDGSRVIEFAEERPDARSVKGEVLMPIEREIGFEDAFAHLDADGNVGSKCGSCHRGEEPSVDYPGAYESAALRPATAETMRLDEIVDAYETCDGVDERRCEILDALLWDDRVRDGDFPRLLPTIYD